ncbi:MAG TPA: hypothetical protein VEC19_10905 [Usitatibacter sp.]|nr:hypothetical protein [Usitatibacter sp.]
MAEVRILPSIALERRTRARRQGLDPAAAVAAAILATAMLLAWLLALSILVYDEPPARLLRMAAAVLGGPALLEPASSLDAHAMSLAMVAHFSFGTLFALAFLGIAGTQAARLPALGIAYGVAAYFALMHGFDALFPWLAELRTPDTAFAFAFFGLVTAQLYQAFAQGASRRA